MIDRGLSFTIDFVCRRDRMVGEIAGVGKVRLNEHALSAAMLHALPPLAGDLLRIGLAVSTADRLTRRPKRQGSGGARAIRLDVGVVEPDFWNERGTTEVLCQALELLSADNWDLVFHGGRRYPVQEYLHCLGTRGAKICLYSGGLDSAAGLATRLSGAEEPLLPLFARLQGVPRSATLGQLDHLGRRYGVQLRPLVVQLAFVRPQEFTHRCRSFLFAALAGSAACAEGSSEVEVYESGVGAINLPLTYGMVTGARTTKSSHPCFLRVMGELVSRVAGRRVDFALPHRDRTKAELVRVIVADGLEELARSTVSCVQLRGRAKQCGYCAACIGRRQAMITAGIVEPVGAYEYDLFGPPEVTNAIPLEKLNYLKATLKQVDRLGELGHRHLPEWFLSYSLGTRVEDSAAALEPWVQVLLRYRKEWLDLVALGQSRGWNWARWLPVSSAA